jgi:hypothetical protein
VTLLLSNPSALEPANVILEAFANGRAWRTRS